MDRYTKVRASLVVSLTLLIASVWGSAAFAAEELDQSTPFASGDSGVPITGNVSWGQIFTAGKSGELTRVGIGVKKESTASELTVSVYASDGRIPTGSALSTTTVTDISAVPTDKEMFYIDFDAPISMEAGSTYAIALSSPDPAAPTKAGAFLWFGGETTYAGGTAAVKDLPYWRRPVPTSTLTFATYVTVPSAATSNGDGSAAAPVTLALALPEGVVCESSSLATSGSWIQLPGASDCSTSARTSEPNPLLLGWATNPEFPLEIAQRQVDNGWGAYETFNDDGQLTAVFIPAGGYTAVTGDTNLYPIWSE